MPRFSAASGIFSPSFLLRLEAAQVELLMPCGRASLVLGIYCVLRMGRKASPRAPLFALYISLAHNATNLQRIALHMSSASRYKSASASRYTVLERKRYEFPSPCISVQFLPSAQALPIPTEICFMSDSSVSKWKGKLRTPIRGNYRE